jgi:hypothetical protein
MDVGDVPFDIEVTLVDIIEFLFKILIDEFISAEELVKSRNGWSLIAIAICKHIGIY